MPKLIAVIDDSVAFMKLGMTILAKAGYEVVSAMDGYAATTLFYDHHPDLALIDINMPLLNGHQLGAILKSSPTYREMPYICVTSNKTPFDLAKMRMCGADGVITKPYNNQALLAEVQRLIGPP